MRALESLPRSWWSVDLPGYRPHPEDYATYSEFPYDELPPAPDVLDDLTWLSEATPVPDSLAEAPDSPPERAATAEQLDLLVGDTPLRLPSSFRAFVATRALHERVRSCTACYLDLGDFPVPAAEGWLVHFLSDQQWVLHWLLYCGGDGAEAVVVTDAPLGFDLGDETSHFDQEVAAVCAESFSEFLWRFRIENEIWFALIEDERPLTSEEREYAAHYARLHE